MSDMVGNVGGTDCPGTAGGIVGGEGVSGTGARVRRRSGRKLGVGGTDGTDRGGKVRGVEVGGTVTVDSVKPFPLTAVVVTRTGSESLGGISEQASKCEIGEQISGGIMATF